MFQVSVSQGAQGDSVVLTTQETYNELFDMYAELIRLA